MSSAIPHDDTPEWRSFYREKVLPFWQQQVSQEQFTSRDGLCIRYVQYRAEAADAPLVIISPGRIEACLKYQEVIWQLAQWGCSVAIIDHRGQGQSARMTANPHQGHVAKFDDFVQDFADFVGILNETFDAAPQLLVGHSMGGAIATLFCANHPHRIQQLILSSPMFAIHTHGIPKPIARAIARFGAWLNHIIARNTPWYFPGMGDYQPIHFDRNELTHSEARYNVFRQVYQDNPDVQLGGPTFNWLAEAFAASDQAVASASKLTLPVTLVQAGADSVVAASGQQAFFQRLKGTQNQVITIDGARHELLMEADYYREPLMQAIQQAVEKVKAQ
ncbi:lysophospholipase [Idiomarina tyrosinivorans]|uniref:Lysophospholipase n=1 Tax=Idiomarina tyrosinivorans TaxID=1445662 RepID=A0A432ZPX5_9GAMM|nr:alpha/beta fold hydrolase [Idiomarina tyrosinivorans]RUO79954.1 lysophospholipase [Idiomarina tyrosinivorans]